MSQILQKAEKAVSSHEPGHRSHGSKEGSKLDPRGDSDHRKFQACELQPKRNLTDSLSGDGKSKPIATVPSEGKTAGNTKKPYPDDIMTSGTIGAHNTEMSNRVEQRVLPDHKLSEFKGGGAHGHHAQGGGSR